MRKHRRTKIDKILLSEIFNDLCEQTRILQTRAYSHHLGTSVLRHSVNVAYLSMLMSKIFRLKVDYYQLIRGALLHDYYLYDCHDKSESNKKKHLRLHPSKAAIQAQKDIELTLREIDIILKHMFPITFALPKSKESAIVCISDKLCAIYEFTTNAYKRTIKKYLIKKLIRRKKYSLSLA